MGKEEDWDIVIKPKNSLLSLNLDEVWRYRDLLRMFVRRDFVAEYKQTILGPIWYLIQPLLQATIYFFIFNKVANFPTGTTPSYLFNLAGLIVWNYFSTCLTKTSDTFIANARIFGKVYFPRLIVPLSIISSNLIKFSMQFALLIGTIFYFHLATNYSYEFNTNLIYLPIPIALLAGLSLSLGIIITSMTTKYRDLKFALSFGVQLLMYGSAIFYSLNSIDEKYAKILKWNPIAQVIEMFRTIMLGNGEINWNGVLYALGFLVILLFSGIIIFNRTEKTFMDTV